MFLWGFSAIFTLMGSEREPSIILDAVIHWIAFTLFNFSVYLWSQNVLHNNNDNNNNNNNNIIAIEL